MVRGAIGIEEREHAGKLLDGHMIRCMKSNVRAQVRLVTSRLLANQKKYLLQIASILKIQAYPMRAPRIHARKSPDSHSLFLKFVNR